MLPATSARDSGSPTGWRPLPVWAALLLLILVSFLPALMFSGVVLWRFGAGERAQHEADAQARSLGIGRALDRELASRTATLTALSTSPALAQDDLATFYRQAREVRRLAGDTIMLSDTAGQQHLNTSQPLGQVLPRLASGNPYAEVVATGKPLVSGLFPGSLSGAPITAIFVPVLQDRQGVQVITGILGMVLRPEWLLGIITAQQLPLGWVVSVMDGGDRVIARSQDQQHFLGRIAGAELRQNARAMQGHWTGRSLDGIESMAFYNRLQGADWRVVVGVPKELMEAPVRQAVGELLAVGVLTVLLSATLGTLLARRITRLLWGLTEAAVTVGRGEQPARHHSAIREINTAHRALRLTAARLRLREAALSTQRARLAIVIDTVPVGMMVADAPSGRLVHANPQASSILGRRLLQQDGTGEGSQGEWPVWDRVDDEGRRLSVGSFPLLRALQGEERPEEEACFVRPDGSRVWVRTIAAPVRNAEGELRGAVAALMDVDEIRRARDSDARFTAELEAEVLSRTRALEAANRDLRQAAETRAVVEAQLRQAQKMEAVGQLSAGVAHDFNNLLTVVIGSLDLLLHRSIGPREHRLAEAAMSGANRAALLVSRLLAFSRQQPLNPRLLDPNALVAGMGDLLHRTLGDQILLETVLDPQAGPIRVDQSGLENAILNLAVNARDAMREPGSASGRGATYKVGRLTIATSVAVLGAPDLVGVQDVMPGDYVVIAVTDTGCGMTSEVVTQVFEPFFTTKPPGQGTGLGMSQVHGFIRQSGGLVTVATTVGEGTTVRLFLPRAGPETAGG